MSDSPETVFDRVSTACRDTGNFLWKHRRKVAVGGVVCAAGLVAYSLYTSSRIKREEEAEAQPIRTAPISTAMKPANQPRMLRRLRKQYEIALRQFLPTLRIRILEVVDVSSAIKRIKELRSTSTTMNEDSARQIEETLWEDIKDSSFTLLYVTAYMVSAICVLLRVQLHILGRSLHDSMERPQLTNPRDIETGGASSYSSGININPTNYTNNNVDDDEPFGDDDTCRLLIEGTYKHIFGAGLQAFADLVKQAVSQSFAGWNVRDKLTVEYSELVHAMSQVRRYIEGDVPSIIRMIMLPPEAVSAIPYVVAEANTGADASDEARKSTSTSTSTSMKDFHSSHSAAAADGASFESSTAPVVADAAVHKLLSQTWDVVESPMFAEVFNEATNTCFRLVYDGLRRNIFSPENPSGHVPSRTPPLASLLPQLKASAAKLVPSDSSLSLCPEVREIAAGPALDTLCIYLFNSPEMMASSPSPTSTSTHASASAAAPTSASNSNASNSNGSSFSSFSASSSSTSAAADRSHGRLPANNHHNSNYSGGPLL